MQEGSRQLGQYQIQEMIAQGGMAQVFKAATYDPQGIERLVVIKRILPHISSNKEYVKMLVDEAKTAVNFNHGNIARIYDLGRVDDDYFIVMEYVDGKTLSQIKKKLLEKKKHFPLDVLLYVFIETCHGLDYVHRRVGQDGKPLGVVHRDISPQNIILSEGGQIKIIDFGVAKADNREEQTESGVLKGKFAYMSPEQARGESLDGRSDIFSTGILLWEMLTGERLFKRKTNHDTVKAVQQAKYQTTEHFRAGLPPDLEHILRRALSKKKQDRYEFAGELAQDLEKLLLKINPAFKPIKAARFLSDLFSGDANTPARAAILTDIAPVELEDKPVLTEQYREAEKSSRDSSQKMARSVSAEVSHNITPIVSMQAVKSMSFRKQVAIGVALFLLGTVYVMLSRYAVKESLLTLTGVDAEMTVFIDGRKLLSDPIRLKLKSDTTYNLLVNKPGYEDFQTSIQLLPNEHKKIAVVLGKKVYPFGDIVISTTPPGATVSIDGIEWSEPTPTTIPKLKAGRSVKLGIYRPKYRFETRDVQVLAGKQIRIEQVLRLDYASVEITSEPSGAKIYFNDKPVGKTPFHSSAIIPGEDVQVRVELESFESSSTMLNVPAGKSKLFHFDLTPR